MFNWFHRNKKESAAVESQTPETTAKVEEEEKQEEKTTPEDYLNWARAAYANIQKQKQQSPLTSPSEEETSPVQVESWETTTEKIEKTTIELETPIESEVESSPITTEKIEKTTIESETESPPTAADRLPAWMEKSDRLEVLKETAIEIEKEQEISLDEDFVWSAQVLASQGRSPDDVSPEEFTWLKRLRQGLGKTRLNLINQLKSIVGQGPLNKDAVMEIEALLLKADVGIEATDYVIETLQNKLREETLPPEEAIAYLKTILQELLDKPLAQLEKTEFEPEANKLNVWLLTGVNGAGKTTTIGKLAHLAQKSGYKCVIAAADTFRAAAVEQVKVWGERTNTPVIANQGQNTDPAAVVYDGINAALSRQADLLLVDTAGRLQNKKNLMAELVKIRRIIDKKSPHAAVESLLVLDSTLGQNGLRQAQVFSEAAKLTGVVLTKLDGSAKGGVALAVSQQLNLPIRFIGAGEGIEDLRPFSSYEFVEALLSN
jgi:fused signal recognition particle receptor